MFLIKMVRINLVPNNPQKIIIHVLYWKFKLFTKFELIFIYLHLKKLIMKLVTVFIALFLSFCISSYGQSSMTITNNSTCPYVVFLWAESPVYLGTTTHCSDIQTHLVVPCCGTTVLFPTPSNFEPIPGWDLLPHGYTSIIGSLCGGIMPYPACYPPDWIWSKAQVDFTGGCTPACPVVGEIGTCLGAGLPLTLTCGSTGSATWTNTGSNVSIDIW